MAHLIHYLTHLSPPTSTPTRPRSTRAGVSHVSAQPQPNGGGGGVATAPLCWEAVFRKETQEEVLADIV